MSAYQDNILPAGENNSPDTQIDTLSAQALDKMLLPLNENLRIERYDHIDSTNSYLQRRAAEGEKEGLIALAEAQSHGRGRKHRSYFSPPGSGLYFSILLRPAIPLADSPFLTVAAAAAAALAIETVSGKAAQIKWVNDVWMNGKKVCGILTEAAMSAEHDQLDYAIVGIGVNVYPPQEGFPAELSDIASTVFSRNQIRPHLRERLLYEIVANFMEFYRNLSDKPFFQAYKDRSFTIGRSVMVIKADVSRKAVVLDVDDQCHLLVRYEDGTLEALNSGEISIKI